MLKILAPIILSTASLATYAQSGQAVILVSKPRTSSAVSLNAAGLSSAVITSSGQLSIGGKPVPVSDEQAILLRKYFVTSEMMLGPGTSSEANRKAQGTQRTDTRSNRGGAAKADQSGSRSLAMNVKQVCSDLAALKEGEAREIKDSIPPMRPYPLVLANDVSSCVDNWN